MTNGRRRILCVDDDEDTCVMLSLLLGQYRYEVITASDSAQAMRLAEGAEKFNLYILDMRFKGDSGVELCRRLRLASPDTPVIFYSGAAYPEDLAEGRNAGALGYVTKPHINRLLEAVQQIFGGAE
jgi:CheY-like chemotaxis protein